MNINQVTAVMIPASDWKEGFDWYARAFPEAQEVEAQGYDFKYLQLGNVAIEVVQADEKVDSGANGSVVYWETDNFDTRLSFLESLGATLYRGPKEIEKGMRMCQVKDPFGNLMGLRGV